MRSSAVSTHSVVCLNVVFAEVIFQEGAGIVVQYIRKLCGNVLQEQKEESNIAQIVKDFLKKVIEDAFIKSYKLLCGDNRDVLDEFIQRVEITLGESNVEKSIIKIEKEIEALAVKKKKLLDMRLEEQIDKATYTDKMEELEQKQKKLLDDRTDFQFPSR